ncbi:DUF2975 domain-containing protein [Polaribacter batillariae]|uniref:DUF2975 domain-containing protein n=1 Tax=Polaribacter batillariae TaxID=2808900 RepID=A0ABX7SXS3_9FLAO|nr:DUF2975 domain-containing protein [Polaribacter batillariae]QTD39065.1 DUF2975 domain-containing protein [Polaribacter batillariae]
MDNIRILKKIVLILFAATLLWFLGDNILVILALLFEKDVLHLGHFNSVGTPISLKILVIIKFIAFCIFIYGASFLIKILLLKNLTDYFNNKTFLYLFKAGKLIIVANFIAFVLSFSIFFISSPQFYVYFNGDSRYLSLLMIIFGFFLMIFSKVLMEAKELKQENDLTI